MKANSGQLLQLLSRHSRGWIICRMRAYLHEGLFVFQFKNDRNVARTNARADAYAAIESTQSNQSLFFTRPFLIGLYTNIRIFF